VYITRASFDRGSVERQASPRGRPARLPSLHYVESGSQPALFLATYLKSLIA